MQISSLGDVFSLGRGPIVFMRFSKRSVKQKCLKQIWHGINWQQKAQDNHGSQFPTWEGLWGKDNELALLYLPPVPAQRHASPLPSSGLWLWKATPMNAITWAPSSAGFGWVWPVRHQQGSEAWRRERWGFPPPLPSGSRTSGCCLWQ